MDGFDMEYIITKIKLSLNALQH